jgi:glycosyltransferase 2 family protein
MAMPACAGDSTGMHNTHRREHRPSWTRVVARTIRLRVPWNWIGIAISVVIVLAASLILFRLLRDIEVNKVVLALRAKPIPDVAAAAVLIMASYAALTFYDFFALRTIGHTTVPYRVAALANFTGYTIGHNLGVTVVGAAIIRLRIYAAWNIGVVDIAKVAFITGLTFWLGNVFVLGAGLLSEPDAARTITELPAWINRSIGLAALGVIAAYLVWLLPRPRGVGRGKWRIVLPTSRLTLLQIAIGVADLCLAALGMQALLPPQPTIDFTALLVIFVAAVLLGFLSHAPGSLGVIEATMLVGLPQFPKEELLASLLVFRVLYFVIPLCLAAILLSARESWLTVKATTQPD